MIEHCDKINPNLKYEIGTEEAIRYFDVDELEKLISGIKKKLNPSIFDKIKYLVIQSGTSLKGNIQTGKYDKNRLLDMVNLAKKYNFLSKEHNGDYIPVNVIKEKFNLGLDTINIAPEFGLIETQTYLDEIKDENIFDKFWKICYDSNRWVKWVNDSFNPYINKEELVKICGHYVLSNEKFLSEIKINFPNIDKKIKMNVIKKLNQFYE